MKLVCEMTAFDLHKPHATGKSGTDGMTYPYWILFRSRSTLPQDPKIYEFAREKPQFGFGASPGDGDDMWSKYFQDNFVFPHSRGL